MQVLQRNLDRLYPRLKVVYPGARIVVVGYPYLFPDRHAPWWQGDCISILRRVDESERRALRALTDRLNAILYDRARTHGLDFVSPAAAWQHHEPCGTEGQYTRAVRPALRILNPVDGGTFHPNRQGQRQLARLIACYLNTNPTGPPPFVKDHPPGSKLPKDVGSTTPCRILLAS